jgi:hypothetical protein
LKSGVIYINSHGEKKPYRLLVWACKSRAAAQKWIVEVPATERVHYAVVRGNGRYYVSVNESGLRNLLYDSNYNTYNALVIGDLCYSAYTIDDLGCYCGFGYNTVIAPGSCDIDMEKMLPRMNGRLENQTCRRAVDAQAKGGLQASFRLVGDGNYTLAPSVENRCQENALPWGPGAGRAGEGRVVFDTGLHIPAGDPAQALIPTVVKGEVTISDIAWLTTGGPGTGLVIYGLTFRYRANCDGAFKVVMRAVAKQIHSDRDPRLQLDGNDGVEQQEEEGKALNQDDFVWSFED